MRRDFFPALRAPVVICIPECTARQPTQPQVGAFAFGSGGILLPCLLYYRCFSLEAQSEKLMLGFLGVFGVLLILTGCYANMTALRPQHM
mmetsp:Transcript_26899/g.63944  ORF Transcript_26899/g.63944 Transcript_26899/m.63944 type:complete len:90 (-) Transcript_26899:44-313(-)